MCHWAMLGPSFTLNSGIAYAFNSCIIVLFMSAFMNKKHRKLQWDVFVTSFWYIMFQAEWMAPEVLRNEPSNEK